MSDTGVATDFAQEMFDTSEDADASVLDAESEELEGFSEGMNEPWADKGASDGAGGTEGDESDEEEPDGPREGQETPGQQKRAQEGQQEAQGDQKEEEGEGGEPLSEEALLNALAGKEDDEGTGLTRAEVIDLINRAKNGEPVEGEPTQKAQEHPAFNPNMRVEPPKYQMSEELTQRLGLNQEEGDALGQELVNAVFSDGLMGSMVPVMFQQMMEIAPYVMAPNFFMHKNPQYREYPRVVQEAMYEVGKENPDAHPFTIVERVEEKLQGAWEKAQKISKQKHDVRKSKPKSAGQPTPARQRAVPPGKKNMNPTDQAFHDMLGGEDDPFPGIG